MALETAGMRNEQFARTGQPTPNAVRDGRVPALLHATHQSRQACLPIFKNRFQMRGWFDNRWETYILADHDMMALSIHGLLELVHNCGWPYAQLDGGDSLPEHDRDAWRELLSTTASFGKAIKLGLFRDLVTPRIVEHLKACLLPPDIAGFRGDLASIKRLVLLNAGADKTWPGLYRDPAVLANLDRAYPLVADSTLHDYRRRRVSRPAKADVADLPERYRCRPLDSCAYHPEVCDRKDPAIAVTRTTLNQGQWLASLAAKNFDTGPGDYSSVLGSALARNWARPDRDGHDMIMWCFSEPLDKAEPVPSDADEYEAYAGYCLSHIWGVSWKAATIYHCHGPLSFPCLRAEFKQPGSRGPLPSRPAVTPGCWLCEDLTHYVPDGFE